MITTPKNVQKNKTPPKTHFKRARLKWQLTSQVYYKWQARPLNCDACLQLLMKATCFFFFFLPHVSSLQLLSVTLQLTALEENRPYKQNFAVTTLKTDSVNKDLLETPSSCIYSLTFTLTGALEGKLTFPQKCWIVEVAESHCSETRK